jgi:hypothetical protein
MEKSTLSYKSQISLENKLKQLEDIIIHKQFILQAGQKLAEKLIINGLDDDALNLLKKIFCHDMSKLERYEFYGMAMFPGFKYDNSKPEKVIIIQEHWKRNSHHPEYWMDEFPNTMMNDEKIIVNFPDDTLLIMEMCCDWYARSLQLNNSVKEFYENHAKIRWNFSTDVDIKIRRYLDLLED